MRPQRSGSVTGSVIVIVATVVLAGAALAAAGTVTKGGAGDDVRWLGSRTTDDGVTLRLTEMSAYRSEIDAFRRMGVPDDCFAEQDVTVGVSTARTAQQLALAFFAGDAPVAAQGFLIEGPQPVEVVVARTPKDAARAVVRFRDGSQDRAPVRDGYVALAHRTPAGRSASTGISPVDDAVVTVFDDDGDRIGRTTTTQAMGSPVDFSRPECRPGSSSSGSGSSSVIVMTPATQPLPEPTGAPPADEDAARAAITAAFEGAYPPGGDVDAALTNVEGGDTPAVRTAREQASAANPQYVGRVTAVVTEIRFLDDHEAAVRFEFRLDGQPFYSPQVGFAVRTADGWKMSRSTYCDQLQTAGPGIKC